MHVDTSGYRVKISSYFTHHIYEVAMITVVGGNKGGSGKLPLHQTPLLLSQIKEGKSAC